MTPGEHGQAPVLRTERGLTIAGTRITLFPVITVASANRRDERLYRERCSSRLIEILLDLDNYLGVGRVFIP